MSKIDDGGPAFPCEANNHGIWPDGSAGRLNPASQGMTLRDWFAGQALEGLLGGRTHATDLPENWANISYLLADAMLVARSAES